MGIPSRCRVVDSFHRNSALVVVIAIACWGHECGLLLTWYEHFVNKMGLPELTTCCVVFDLKTGCIIMGGINAVMSFTLLSLMIVLAAEVGAIDAAIEYAGDVEMQAGITGLYAMSIILVFMFLIKFLFDVVFVYGVATERAVIIKAYMIMWIVFFLLSMFIFFLNAGSISAGTICTEVIYIAHNVYTILLCNSFYKQLNSREEV